MIEIYDVVGKKAIQLPQGKIVKTCKKLGFDYSAISRMKLGEAKYVKSRYILPEHKDKIFVFVNFSTGEEYECICNSTMSHYLGYPISRKATRAFSNLAKRKQKLASIDGKIFMLKGVEKTDRFHFLKAADDKYIKLKKEKQLMRKISLKLSARIRGLITKKSKKTQELIGCNYDFLMGYLERQFTNGMTWENCGNDGWHIDHIKPCASFDLSQPDQQKICFHYTNLQPLWGTNAIAKKYGEENYIGNIEKSNQNIIGGRQT
jgi:MoaA/NifB/PqqE/SkfB family radical SAM enzyme